MKVNRFALHKSGKALVYQLKDTSMNVYNAELEPKCLH